MEISTQYYSPVYFPDGPTPNAYTMFGDADIEGNLSEGFTYQEILDYLDANQDKLGPNNVKGAQGGVYEKVRLGSIQEAQAAKLESDAAQKAAEQERRLKQLEIASRTAQQNQLAGSKAAQLQLQSVSKLPGSQGGTSAFKRRPLQIKPQVSTGLLGIAPAAASSIFKGINV